MTKRVGKRGDTLIEVMLAVGIFSMVAVAVVAVMSGGTSSAQTALETTLAREEIDAQAEALRFIQSSYIAEKGSENHNFEKLWGAITSKAIDLDSLSDDEKNALLQYSPTSCSALYEEEGEVKNHGFIINMRGISDALNGSWSDDSLSKNMIIDGKEEGIMTGEYRLEPAATYPHLIFTKDGDDETTDEGNLVEETGDKTKLYRAEGIYIIAVKDPKTTIIIGETGSSSAYYDFYIRTCWYGTSDQAPSTISTVMRLYDPGAIGYGSSTP